MSYLIRMAGAAVEWGNSVAPDLVSASPLSVGSSLRTPFRCLLFAPSVPAKASVRI
jgi:hypothetical protein